MPFRTAPPPPPETSNFNVDPPHFLKFSALRADFITLQQFLRFNTLFLRLFIDFCLLKMFLPPHFCSGPGKKCHFTPHHPLNRVGDPHPPRKMPKRRDFAPIRRNMSDVPPPPWAVRGGNSPDLQKVRNLGNTGKVPKMVKNSLNLH